MPGISRDIQPGQHAREWYLTVGSWNLLLETPKGESTPRGFLVTGAATFYIAAASNPSPLIKSVPPSISDHGPISPMSPIAASNSCLFEGTGKLFKCKATGRTVLEPISF